MKSTQSVEFVRASTDQDSGQSDDYLTSLTDEQLELLANHALEYATDDTNREALKALEAELRTRRLEADREKYVADLPQTD